MKAFLACYVSWLIALFLFLCFFGGILSGGQHFYLSLLVLALIPAVITYVFYRQSEAIDELRARLDKLEGKEELDS